MEQVISGCQGSEIEVVQLLYNVHTYTHTELFQLLS